MLDIQAAVSLQPFNTLSLPATAEFFCRIHTRDDLFEALEWARQKNIPVTPLGGGSNLVLVDDLPGLVLQIAIPGIALAPGSSLGEQRNIHIGAGENWHQLVLHTLEKGWYGLENLSLIPGLAGAAPIQNIGAYGIELSELFHSLEAVHLPTGELHTMLAADCRFGYRDSLFKQAGRNQYVITAITLSLSARPHLRLTYPALLQALEGCDAASLTPAMVSAAVCEVRRSKLPDPASLPNTGSFFKNPVVTENQAIALRQQFPDIVCYPQADGTVKLAAGWLVEQAGWRGVMRDRVGVHARQSLVLVNFGGGTGAELLSLAEEISGSVQKKFAVALEIEPTIYPVRVKT
ncbi:UDP-N-acetylmuramate dehydrogenase [Porticoccus sp.]|uniref:UDP-N-acetylmuramate dehydrogenase n=1 Tax=Porticoccus sp. TaxID=2024853 RepID=UPI003F6956FD